MSGYQNLEIYTLAKHLALDVHNYSLTLPKYELYETGAQIRRSTKSILFNIVEGYGRRKYINEYVRFLTFSQASCDEAFVQLELLIELYPDIEIPKNILDDCDRLGKKINRFIQAILNNQK
jgi:four helix bundle protein